MTTARPTRTSADSLDAESLFTVAADFWGYLESEPLDGWELRAGAGFTNRANSVWPLGPLRRPLPQALDEIRAWYAHRGLSPQVLAEIGSEFDAALTEHGCGAGHDDALRQTAAIAPALEALNGRQHPNVPLSTADRPQDRWLRLYRQGAVPPQAKEILGSGERYQYATIYDEYSGEPLAIGRAALDRESGTWVGLAGIETAPEARRRGLARLILRTLLAWAADQGAEHAMLEVRRGNEAALALYRQLGFVTAQEYHYRSLSVAE
ncbi:MAG TPA: GNAT family N-acetyltransferase [Actinospica sp.]|nr:GNAT family N-acetyltransferase [Actinospica sp.]